MANDIEVIARSDQIIGIDGGHHQTRLADQGAGQDIPQRPDDDAASTYERPVVIPMWHLNTQLLGRRLYLASANDKTTTFVGDVPH